jgi:hypothetical protein
MWGCASIVRTDVSEERAVSIFSEEKCESDEKPTVGYQTVTAVKTSNPTLPN